MSTLRGVIGVFRTGTYTVTRHATGSYANGRYVEAAPTTVSDVVASVQPAEPRTLQALPEAFHSTDVKVIFTETALKPRTPTQAPDEISIDGETYVVIKSEKWDAFGGTHYRALAALKIEGAV